MTTYISNAFALSMVPDGATIRTQTVDLPSIAHKLGNPISVVGHKDTARVFSNLLGIEVAYNRVSISITPKDTLYVGQLTGGRLPEGATTIPEGFQIKWICVHIDGAPVQMERHWTYRGGSIYGSLDRLADKIADVVGGTVEVMADPWGNPNWDIKAPGFNGSLHDE